MWGFHMTSRMTHRFTAGPLIFFFSLSAKLHFFPYQAVDSVPSARFLRTERVRDAAKWRANCQRAGAVRREMNLLQKINPGENGSASDSPPRNATKPVLFPWQPYQRRFLAACSLCTNQKWQINNVDSITHPPRCLSFPPVAALVWISGAPVRQDKSTADQDSSRVHHPKKKKWCFVWDGKLNASEDSWRTHSGCFGGQNVSSCSCNFLREKQWSCCRRWDDELTCRLVLCGPATHARQKSTDRVAVVVCIFAREKKVWKLRARRRSQWPKAEIVQLHKGSAERFWSHRWFCSSFAWKRAPSKVFDSLSGLLSSRSGCCCSGGGGSDWRGIDRWALTQSSARRYGWQSQQQLISREAADVKRHPDRHVDWWVGSESLKLQLINFTQGKKKHTEKNKT